MADAPLQAPGAQASISSLSEDLLERIGLLVTDSLCPMYDRGDLLHQACTLALVGNDACTALARLLFAFLSPRLGELGGSGPW